MFIETLNFTRVHVCEIRINKSFDIDVCRINVGYTDLFCCCRSIIKEDIMYFEITYSCLSLNGCRGVADPLPTGGGGTTSHMRLIYTFKACTKLIKFVM